MNTILVHLPAVLLVILRIGGLMVFAPVLSSKVVPLRLRIVLTLVLGISMYPILLGIGAVSTEGLSLEPGTFLPLAVREVFIGMVIGLVASLPLVALQMGGLLMGQQMGLGFATLYDPAMDDQGDVLGRLFFFLALASFLLVNGHEAVVTAVLRSFDHVPAGSFSVDTGVLSLLSGMLLSAMEVSLRVAVPVIAIIFLMSIAMGFVSRTVPQFNILSLGFPLRILVGFTVMIAGLVVIENVVMEAIDTTLNGITEWVETR
ncbi:MAG: flagellar biosynthetic protein FliR [Planctomycetota bacterium]|nr:flagellar biosynthetic protein FliR [Planctomycetota bacterium]